MGRRGFYEDYKQEKQKNHEVQTNRPAMIRHSFGAAVMEFIIRLFTAVFYLAVIILANIGLVTILNAPIRDMLFELVKNVLF